MSLVTQAWLESSNRRCVLVEFTINKLTATSIGTDTAATGTQTLFYSTSGYLTSSGDVHYQPLVVGGLKFTESLSTDGTISVTYGDVELYNKNGNLDAYLDNSKYIWVNGTINIYYGDPAWEAVDISAVRNDFELIFSGVIADIDSLSRESINIKVRDKLQRLNTPITESKINNPYGTWASGQNNTDVIIPIIFGEVFNISPVLINPAPGAGAAEYVINGGTTLNSSNAGSSTAEFIEARDNGVPVVLDSQDISTGKFVLSKPLVGTLTMDAKGQNRRINFPDASSAPTLVTSSYDNNIASIIALIATEYGNSANKLSLTNDIDRANFFAFKTANTQPIGIYITDRENTLDVCNQIASSVGAQLFMTRQGKLQLLRYGFPNTADPTISISTSDIVLDSLYISNRSMITASTKLAYAKNWTAQPNLVTAIPEPHKDNYATEWLTTTVTDSTVKTNYKLDAEPVQKETLLITDPEATAEATRLNNYFKSTRTTYSFKGTATLLRLKLGQPVTLTHPRFGLEAGATGQVVSLSPDWTACTIDVEVLV